MKTLLGPAESREGSEIGWDEWKNHVVVLPLGFEVIGAWVSGCRLFCVCEGKDVQDAKIKVYNFSTQNLAKYLRESVDGGFDAERGSSKRDDRCRMGRPLPNGAGAKIPWHDLGGRHVGHDCSATP